MYGVKYKRNERLVRGLDYYNGTCFEIKVDEDDDQDGKISLLSESKLCQS